MPSERSRYLNRNRSLARPFDYEDLRAGLVDLGIDRLADILLSRAENDEVIAQFRRLSDPSVAH